MNIKHFKVPAAVRPWLGCIPVGLWIMSLWMFGDQFAALTRWIPVEATVERVGVERRVRHSGDERVVEFRPAVRYVYSVAGEEFRSDVVTPMDRAYSQHRARQLIVDFAVGQRVTAHHHPRRPERAYLVSHHDTLPYVMALIASMASAGLMIAWEWPAAPRPRPSNDRPGKFVYRAPRPLQRRLRFRSYAAAFWLLGAVLGVGGGLLLASRPYDMLALATTAVYLGFGVILTPMLWNTYWAQSVVGDPVLYLSKEIFTLGESIDVELHQPFRTDTLVESLTAELVLEGPDPKSSSKKDVEIVRRFETALLILENRPVRAGRMIRARVKLKIPTDQLATHASPGKRSSSDDAPSHLYDWWLEFHVRAGASYTASFPIAVREHREAGGAGDIDGRSSGCHALA